VAARWPAGKTLKSFRPILFWAHLAAGLIAGAVIGIMCFTGSAPVSPASAAAFSSTPALPFRGVGFSAAVKITRRRIPPV
jgi:hypothetical protein